MQSATLASMLLTFCSTSVVHLQDIVDGRSRPTEVYEGQRGTEAYNSKKVLFISAVLFVKQWAAACQALSTLCNLPSLHHQSSRTLATPEKCDFSAVVSAQAES